MALIKEIELESGVTAGYHNAEIIKKTDEQKVFVQVHSYLDKQARLDGKVPLARGSVLILPDEYNSPIEDATYAYLKTLPEFNGAIDD